MRDLENTVLLDTSYINRLKLIFDSTPAGTVNSVQQLIDTLQSMISTGTIPSLDITIGPHNRKTKFFQSTYLHLHLTISSMFHHISTN